MPHYPRADHVYDVSLEEQGEAATASESWALELGEPSERPRGKG